MRILVLFFGLVLVAGAADKPAAESRVRPAEWAAPVVPSTLDNCFRVSADLYRCEQPAVRDLAALRGLGVRTLLNLRHRHTDAREFTQAGLVLLKEPMSAGTVTVEQLVSALRQYRAAPKPVLVHCWHGSDRTGIFVAAYRIVFENWTREAALEEFRHGGYGFHEKWFPNLVTLLQSLDAADLRRRVEG